MDFDTEAPKEQIEAAKREKRKKKDGGRGAEGGERICVKKGRLASWIKPCPTLKITASSKISFPRDIRIWRNSTCMREEERIWLNRQPGKGSIV